MTRVIDALILALTLVGSAFVATPAAYPPTPTCLRSLIGSADLIVWADVTRVGWLEWGDRTHLGKFEAVLRVIRCLEGPGSAGDVVPVVFDNGAVCPVPESYPEGVAVLAFLRNQEAGPLVRYGTVGLGDGIKQLSADVVRVYAARTRELLAIERETDVASRTSRLHEWITAILADPTTRREGLLDMGRDADIVRSRGQVPLDIGQLSAAQRERLLDALESEPEGGWKWAELAHRLGDQAGPRLDAVLKSMLRHSMASRSAAGQAAAMALLAKRLDDEELRKLAKTVSYMGSYRVLSDERTAERNELIERFLAEADERHPDADGR